MSVSGATAERTVAISYHEHRTTAKSQRTDSQRT